MRSACCAPKARLQHRRRKCPWGALPWKIEIPSQPPNFRLQIKLVILPVPTFSPQSEQYNRVRGSSVLAHATGGPKSRKLHPGEFVEKSARLPSKPPYKKPESKGRLWSPLARLSPLSFVVQRKMGPPEVVGLVERLVKKRTAKDIAPGGPTEKRMPVKKQNKKTTPPGGRPEKRMPV